MWAYGHRAQLRFKVEPAALPNLGVPRCGAGELRKQKRAAFDARFLGVGLEVRSRRDVRVGRIEGQGERLPGDLDGLWRLRDGGYGIAPEGGQGLQRICYRLAEVIAHVHGGDTVYVGANHQHGYRTRGGPCPCEGQRLARGMDGHGA